VSWDKTVRQIVRESHQAGALDVLRAVLDQFDLEPEAVCLARSWAERMYRDPDSFNQFIRDSQAAREGTR
jgi:hypothetical protein